jgi:hypothetical protein
MDFHADTSFSDCKKITKNQRDGGSGTPLAAFKFNANEVFVA